MIRDPSGVSELAQRPFKPCRFLVSILSRHEARVEGGGDGGERKCNRGGGSMFFK